jgi:hypothetical protein
MGLPARCYDSLSEVYTAPKESFLRKYGTRIAGGLACAAVVSFIMHLPYIKQVILWGCQLVIFVFGRPAGYDRIPEIKNKAVQAVAKAKEIVHGHKAAAVIVPLPIPKVAAKLKEEAPLGKNAAATIKAVEKTAKGAEKIAHAGQDMAKAVKDTGTKAKEAVEKTTDRIAKAIHRRKEAKEQERYDKLIVRARVAGLKVDESWSVTRLEAEVEQVEEVAWHKRYNAQCPRCHRPTYIRKGLKYERFICPRCRFIYSVEWARSLGAPPRVHPGGGWRLPW